MTWETLAWRTAGDPAALVPEPFAELLAEVVGSLERAVGERTGMPVAITELASATAARDELPVELVGVGSFQLLGAPRQGAWLALDASVASLGGAPIETESLGRLLGETAEAAIVARLGEPVGLSWESVIAPPDDEPLVLLRFTFRADDGSELRVALAAAARVVGDIATHVATLEALAPPVGAAATAGPDAPAASGGPAIAQDEPALDPASIPADGPGANGVRPVVLDELVPAATRDPGRGIDLLLGVSLKVTVEIGRTELPIRDVLGLTPGSIVQLDKLAGEKVDVLVNGRRIALGEVVVVDDNFGVRVTSVVAHDPRLMPAEVA